jgi:hypothetical protein
MLKPDNRVGEPIRAVITEGLPDSIAKRSALSK